MLKCPPLARMHEWKRNTHQVHDGDDLQQPLMKVWRGLGQSVINDAMDE